MVFRATGHTPNKAVTFPTLDMTSEIKWQCKIKNVQHSMHLCTALAFASTWEHICLVDGKLETVRELKTSSGSTVACITKQSSSQSWCSWAKDKSRDLKNGSLDKLQNNAVWIYCTNKKALQVKPTKWTLPTSLESIYSSEWQVRFSWNSAAP